MAESIALFCLNCAKVQINLFIFNSALFTLFSPFEAIFEVGVRFKNFFGTYLCRESTLLLWSTALSFCFYFGNIWSIFCTFLGPRGYFFGSLGLFLWSGAGSKNFLEPTYIDDQLWFWKYNPPIFLFLIQPNVGPFLHFLDLSVPFLRWGSSSKTFLGPTNID